LCRHVGPRTALGVRVVGTSAEHPRRAGGSDLVPLEELIRGTRGAHPIGSVDELRCDAFESDEELDEFLAFVTQSRHADLA
jgi:hypothetical protein